MPDFIQDSRRLAVETPLGKNALLLTSFSGHEEISRLFGFKLDMLSEDDSLAAPDLVGQAVSVTMTMSDGRARNFHGFVSRLAYLGTAERFSRYTAEVVPWLWFLTRTADCRVYQKKSIPTILSEIFDELGFSDYELDIKGKHPEWEYCVQYRETDFNFVSRLMEQEGIHYHFRFEEGRHVLVVSDHNGAFQACLEEEVEFVGAEGTPQDSDQILSWEHRYSFVPGKWAVTDYNYETPTTSLLTASETVIKLDALKKYEVFDYPGEYEKTVDGEGDTQVRMEAQESSFEVVHAHGKCRSFFAGGKFKLIKHQRSKEEGLTFLVRSIHHSCESKASFSSETDASTDSYENTFTCVPESAPFRPARITPKPVIQGAQTAIVVGPAGEEIYTDEQARVKVQFFWDRLGKRDQDSSCWIRVSQPWAGKGFGSQATPRIGEEVVVDFLEGDPDRPLVTGRVYNGQNKPPYGENGVVSGLKSNSTPGGGGSNEMSMNDTKGKELINIHAQYDMVTTIEHDETHTVKSGNRTIGVEAGTHTETIKGDTTITISTGNYTHKVSTGTATVGVKGAVKETFDASQDTTVKDAITITSTAGAVTINGATSITLVTGASKLSMDSGGTITLSGKTIKVIGDAEVNVSGPKIGVAGGDEAKLGVGSNSITCDKAKVTSSGAAISASAVGTHEISGALVKIN